MAEWYKVFISSTSDDLRDERDKVMRVLLKINCVPLGMENFPSTGESQWDIIKRDIRSADYVIFILAGRYGTVNKSGIGGLQYKGLSYTEMEYEYAVSQDKTVIPFFYKDIKNLPASKCESSQFNADKLKKLRMMIEKEKEVQYWNNTDELCTSIATSLYHSIHVSPKPGLISSPDLLLLQEEKDELVIKCQMLERCLARQRGEYNRLMKELEDLYNSKIL